MHPQGTFELPCCGVSGLAIKLSRITNKSQQAVMVIRRDCGLGPKQGSRNGGRQRWGHFRGRMRRGLKCLKLCGGEEKGERETRMALSALLGVAGLQMPLLMERSGGGTQLAPPLILWSAGLTWQQPEAAFKLTDSAYDMTWILPLFVLHTRSQSTDPLCYVCITLSLFSALRSFKMFVMTFIHLYSLTHSTLDPLLFLNSDSFWSIVKFCEKLLT